MILQWDLCKGSYNEVSVRDLEWDICKWSYIDISVNDLMILNRYINVFLVCSAAGRGQVKNSVNCFYSNYYI